MLNSEIRLMEDKLENLYQSMLTNIIFYMDEKKITLKDLQGKLNIPIEKLEQYFSIEKGNFSIYDELLRIVKEW